MANKVLNSRTVMKHDTSANWEKATAFIPLSGEIIIYTDLNKFKLGDGTNIVVDLPFAGGTEILANGILKGDGAGNISAAVAGTDYQAPLPEVSNDKYLHTNASTGALEWSEVDALPSQSGQSGKFLTTNGTTASWADISNSFSGAITIISGVTNYTITHNLGTKAIIVQVYDNATFTDVIVEVSRPTFNTINIEFSQQPTAGSIFIVNILAPNISTHTLDRVQFYSITQNVNILEV